MNLHEFDIRRAAKLEGIAEGMAETKISNAKAILALAYSGRNCTLL